MDRTERWNDAKLAALLDLLRRRRETVTTVESCTGGLLAGRITDIPGSSDVFHQGFITYCDEAKARLAGVSRDTLDKYTDGPGRSEKRGGGRLPFRYGIRGAAPGTGG